VIIPPDPAGDPFEALGDPNRREILRLLSSGDKPVQEIAAAMPISRPASRATCGC
jgi:DNA-binding transcriptional ArsR family regulator